MKHFALLFLTVCVLTACKTYRGPEGKKFRVFAGVRDGAGRYYKGDSAIRLQPYSADRAGLLKSAGEDYIFERLDSAAVSALARQFGDLALIFCYQVCPASNEVFRNAASGRLGVAPAFLAVHSYDFATAAAKARQYQYPYRSIYVVPAITQGNNLLDDNMVALVKSTCDTCYKLYGDGVMYGSALVFRQSRPMIHFSRTDTLFRPPADWLKQE